MQPPSSGTHGRCRGDVREWRDGMRRPRSWCCEQQRPTRSAIAPNTDPGSVAPSPRQESRMTDYTAVNIEEIEGRFGGAFKLLRASLGVSAFGMQIIDMPPGGGEFYPEHAH